MEIIQLAFFWTLLVGSLLTILVVGVVAGGVSYNRLERIAVDMSTDEDSLSKAEEGLPYQPIHAKQRFGDLFRVIKNRGKAA